MLNKHLFLSLLMAVSTATVSAETHHAQQTLALALFTPYYYAQIATSHLRFLL